MWQGFTAKQGDEVAFQGYNNGEYGLYLATPSNLINLTPNLTVQAVAPTFYKNMVRTIQLVD